MDNDDIFKNNDDIIKNNDDVIKGYEVIKDNDDVIKDKGDTIMNQFYDYGPWWRQIWRRCHSEPCRHHNGLQCIQHGQ